MLRQGSTELPSSFTPQWLHNKQAGGSGTPDPAHKEGGASKQAGSPTAASRREEKPWVAERWSIDKDADSKWSHDPPFDRAGARWGEDERERERLVAGPRREPGRCVCRLWIWKSAVSVPDCPCCCRWKPSERDWGGSSTIQSREPYAAGRRIAPATQQPYKDRHVNKVSCRLGACSCRRPLGTGASSGPPCARSLACRRQGGQVGTQ